MKTTLEIPDPIFRRAKSVAAARGISLREFVTEAIKDKLVAESRPSEKPWVKLMGKLKRLHEETLRINRLIEKDSERIDPNVAFVAVVGQSRCHSEGLFLARGISLWFPAKKERFLGPRTGPRNDRSV
jgi:hypothetical protein